MGAKSDMHSARMSKSFRHAETKAKGIADSARDRVNIEKSFQHLHQRSDAVNRAATTYIKKQEEFLIEGTKCMSKAVHQNKKDVQQNCGGLVGQVTESMQRGMDLAKAKSDIHSARMSKGFAHAEKKAKVIADSTRDKVTAFFQKNPFRFGA